MFTWVVFGSTFSVDGQKDDNYTIEETDCSSWVKGIVEPYGLGSIDAILLRPASSGATVIVYPQSGVIYSDRCSVSLAIDFCGYSYRLSGETCAELVDMVPLYTGGICRGATNVENSKVERVLKLVYKVTKLKDKIVPGAYNTIEPMRIEFLVSMSNSIHSEISISSRRL